MVFLVLASIVGLLLLESIAASETSDNVSDYINLLVANAVRVYVYMYI